MPYKSKADKVARDKVYARERAQARRAKVLDGKVCANCGGTDRIEFDHVEPLRGQGRITSWWMRSEAVVAAELAKMQVLCRPCHIAKTIEGQEKPGQCLTPQAVLEIRRLASEGLPQWRLAEMFGCSRVMIHKIVRRKSWVHI